MSRASPLPLIVAILTLLTSQAFAAEPLRLCLDENAPPFSFNRGGTVGGFDLELAQTIADGLGLSLKIQWFNTEDQPEAGKDTKTSIAALLADDRCDISGSYPLFADDINGSLTDQGHLPRIKGGTKEDQRRLIALSPLIATVPFVYTAPVIVLGPDVSVSSIRALADLDGLRIGVEQSTWADIILTAYQQGRFLPQLHHIPPGGGLLERLEAAQYDATLVDLHRFDGYRLTHPTTPLKLTSFLHPLGFNLGFVGLARKAELIGAVDAVVNRELQDGTIERVAIRAGLTYLPPRDPAVRLLPSPPDLLKE